MSETLTVETGPSVIGLGFGKRMPIPGPATPIITPGSVAGVPLTAAPRPLKFDYLVAQRFVSREQLAAALAEAKEQQQSAEAVLMAKYGVRKTDIGISLGLFYRCPFIAFDKRIIVPPDLLKSLHAPRLKAAGWIPIRRDGDVVTVAMKDPHDLPEVDSVERLFGSEKVKVKIAVAVAEDIAKLIDASFGGDSRSIMGDVADLKTEEEVDGESAQATAISESDNTVIRLAHQIIADAYRDRASDIHVEPCNFTKHATVRFRVDGTCIEYETIPGSLTKPLVGRLKIMAHLDIAERRRPQDGKMRVRLGSRDLELRVATIPTVGGNEDVILRLLPEQDIIPIEHQELSERNLRELEALARRPYGLILCVGPTGSGKTTTLHAVLHYINTPDRKIWTAEDPVEITQPGLRQVQVSPKIGFTFATAMRAFLRGDPDVIMVGEMRDSETAGIAIEASLTGHLVLSTLHTNSAAETVVRMLDMGLDAFNFADALLGVLAQRLVKRVCPDCAQPYTPGQEEIDELVREYGGPEEWSQLGQPADQTLTLMRGKGCESCKQTGYRGRLAIHELLVGSDEIRGMILSKARVPDILRVSRQQGMTTLMQDGIRKVLAGLVDFRQVKAVAVR